MCFAHIQLNIFFICFVNTFHKNIYKINLWDFNRSSVPSEPGLIVIDEEIPVEKGYVCIHTIMLTNVKFIVLK